MVKQPFIHIRNAEFGYKSKAKHQVVLRVEDLQIETAGSYALVGSNGAGKSTFLRSIAGLQPLLAGDIFIEGEAVATIENQRMAQLLAVVLTQRVGGFNLTVADAIQSARMPFTNWYNKATEADLAAVAEAVAKIGLQQNLQTALHELSDGMFQKTMIARALAQNSKAIVLDEPAAFLDFASKHRLFLLLQELATAGNKCIIASTHDLDLALKYCQHIVLLDNSTLRLIPASEAKNDEGFKDLAGNFL